MMGLSLVGSTHTRTQDKVKHKVHKQYEAMSYIVDVEKTKKNSIVYAQVESGDVFMFVGYAEKGEWLILTMDDNGTEKVTDDIVVDVREDEESK